MNGRKPRGFALLAVAVILAVLGLGVALRPGELEIRPGSNFLTGGLEGAGPVTVAFIGDQGVGDDARAVLELIRGEGADMVIHQGDFDYKNDPERWDRQIDETLGEGFPYFASVGNHDVREWDGYQARLAARLERVTGAVCTGELGVRSVCRYRGILFALSGVGTMGVEHVPFLDDALASNRAVWRICSWHKNQKAAQIGGKGNDVGWAPYETCRRHGAIIATGHAHSYARTRTLSDVESAEIDETCVDDAATAGPDVCVGPGATFLFVSGLGGRGIREQKRCQPASYPYGCDGEWAKIYAKDQGAQFGALFITFDTSPGDRTAQGYFKTIDGDVIDSFTITITRR